MSVLVYTESENGKFKKSAFEALSYGRDLANNCNQKLIAISINGPDSKILSNYGPIKFCQSQSLI